MSIRLGCSMGLLMLMSVMIAPGREGMAVKSVAAQKEPAEKISLPAPARTGRMSLEEALARRRSVREFAAKTLSLEELSQLLWSAQGITHPDGLRTAPSAGALYPLELYVATPSGFVHYDPKRHELQRCSERDLRKELSRAALDQEAVRDAPAVFVFAAVFERTSKKYGEARTPRYVHMEAGHAAQNLLLQAVALGLGGVPVGAFSDAQVSSVLSLPADHRPLYLVPVGRPR